MSSHRSVSPFLRTLQRRSIGVEDISRIFPETVTSRTKESFLTDFLIIGSEYTHSDDNPTGFFAVTESGVIRTLKEGFELNVLHIDTVATELPYVYVIGDADYDLELTIKDATMIQKILAGLEEYKSVVCVSRPEDKDRDGRVTIKDATAIQKHIAGFDC